MPAILILGFDLELTRIMLVAVLGGLLGILMMIPLRRALIVREHGRLKYPEGTACAEVLIAGEKGGASAAKMVFIGFGLAFGLQAVLCSREAVGEPNRRSHLYRQMNLDGTQTGSEGGECHPANWSPELLGVGYLIGPRIACLMMAGAVLSFFVIGPTIATFGEKLTEPVALRDSGS
jgi:putative OPT family oligopeptide transporter